MHSNNLFLELQEVSELVEKLMNTGKHEIYPLVYLLLKLILTISVATATVKKSFFSNEIYKK